MPVTVAGVFGLQGVNLKLVVNVGRLIGIRKG